MYGDVTASTSPTSFVPRNDSAPWLTDRPFTCLSASASRWFHWHPTRSELFSLCLAARWCGTTAAWSVCEHTCVTPEFLSTSDTGERECADRRRSEFPHVCVTDRSEGREGAETNGPTLCAGQCPVSPLVSQAFGQSGVSQAFGQSSPLVNPW